MLVLNVFLPVDKKNIFIHYCELFDCAPVYSVAYICINAAGFAGNEEKNALAN